MEYIATLQNGKKVYFRQNSPAATHINDTPQLLSLLSSFFEQQSFDEPIVYIDHNAGKVIGTTDLVDLHDGDEITYAKRLNRDTFTAFAKNRQPAPTSYFTFAIQMDKTGDYELASAWIGRKAPQFPDEINATPESKVFWSQHALAWGTQAVQTETITTICPW